MADTPPRAAARARANGRSTPPPTEPPKVEPRPKAAGRKPSRSAIAKKIENQVVMAGMMVGAADPVSGFILCANAENFGDSWGAVAAVNPAVKRVLESWFETSVYMDCGLATVAIVAPIATHLGWLPRGWFNPTGMAVDGIEKAAQTKTMQEMLIEHAANIEAANAMRAMFAMDGDDDDADADTVDMRGPDHFEVPR